MPKSEEYMLAALAKRFAAPAYAFIPHCANATGAVATRTADAIAMSLWPSRGLELHGFEVKVDRSDWLRELKDPKKADDLFGYFDRWWLVVSEASIVAEGELPPTWGLMESAGAGIRVRQEAPKLEPQKFTRHFLAAILRRAWEQTTNQSAIRRAYDQGYMEGK